MNLLEGIPQELLDRLPEFLLHPDPLIYMSDNFVTVDLETNMKGDGGSPMPCWPANSIVCGSWCYGREDFAHNIYGNELEIEDLVNAIEDTDFVVMHNGKFDLGWLKRAGIDLYKVVLYDTMIGEYVRLGNRQGELSLGALCKREFGWSKAAYVDICMKNKVDPEDMPKSKLIDRCDTDILMTRDLFLIQRQQLHHRGLLPCVYTRCLLSPALADIESRGVCLDVEAVEKEYRESSIKLAAVSHELNEFSGGVNPNSPKQMAEFIYDVLKFKPKMKGYGSNKVEVRGTAADVILSLKATTRKQKKFIELKKEYSRHNADVSKTLLFFHGVVTDKSADMATFFAQFNQCITKTHRLSSSGIKREFPHILDANGKATSKSTQLQNSPRKFKPLYKSRHEGWKMVEADGAQLEFRVAAFLGQCAVANQEIIDGKDVHRQSASVINECSEEEVTGEMRTAAKAKTFLPLFGGTNGTEREMAYYRWFKEHYTGITNAQQGWIDEALVHKQVKMVHGFIFHYPDAKMGGNGYVQGNTNIRNYPIQSLATAEIIPIAIVYLWHLMKEMESFINNTVHDSTITELHPDEEEEFKECALHAFTTLVYYYLYEVYGVEFNVPLGLGVKIGDNWGKGIEYVCSPLPPFLMDGVDYTNLQTDWEID
jgi:DNA polymerase-1